MSDTPFDDWEDDPEDSEAIEAYADSLRVAVEALGVTVREPGEQR